jgi:hypothetical protein
MRKLLNNPKVVILGALIATCALFVRMGYLDKLNIKGYFEKASNPEVTFNKKDEVFETRASQVAQAFTKELWLPNNWQQLSGLRRELFVGEFYLESDFLPQIELASGEVIDALPEITEEQLQSYIAENMGLDEDGFFVRFGIIRKREGDDLKIKDRQMLKLGKIAIPDQGQWLEKGGEDSLELLIQSFLLDATSPVEAEVSDITPEEDATEADLYREGDFVSAAEIAEQTERREFASAVIRGGINVENIYREGDLVSRVPAIGLASVAENSVQLVDRDGRLWELQLRH